MATPAKKAPAKKASVKKAPAKKAPAKKAPAVTAEQSEAAELKVRKDAAVNASAGARALMAAMEDDDRDRHRRHLEAQQRRDAYVTLFEGKPTALGTKYQGDTLAPTLVVATLLIAGGSTLLRGGNQAVGMGFAIPYGIVLLVLAYRAYTAAIYTGPDGIIVKNMVRTRHVPWDEVRGYGIARGYGGYRRGTYVLVLKLSQARTLKLSAFRVAGRAQDINASMRQAALTIEKQRRTYATSPGDLELVGQAEEEKDLPLNAGAL